jgi:hypothetical protein
VEISRKFNTANSPWYFFADLSYAFAALFIDYFVVLRAPFGYAQGRLFVVTFNQWGISIDHLRFSIPAFAGTSLRFIASEQLSIFRLLEVILS